MATDRHKISSNALNDITSSIIRESQGRIEDFVLSETSTLKGRQKLCCKKVDNVKEKFLVDVNNHYSTIHWMKNCKNQEKHSITTNAWRF